ncbi:hypothetical protein ACOJBO_03660 [Rhizobium beringeri]
MLTKVASLVPTHTRRSEESQALQQFSTLIPLAYVASRAAGLIAADVVLRPSAGTGMIGDLCGAGTCSSGARRIRDGPVLAATAAFPRRSGIAARCRAYR